MKVMKVIKPEIVAAAKAAAKAAAVAEQRLLQRRLLRQGRGGVYLDESYAYWGTWNPLGCDAELVEGLWELVDHQWGEIKRVSQVQFQEWLRNGCLRVAMV